MRAPDKAPRRVRYLIKVIVYKIKKNQQMKEADYHPLPPSAPGHARHGACHRDPLRRVCAFGRQSVYQQCEKYTDVGMRSEGLRGLSFRTRFDDYSRRGA